jgi:TolA-binding protein
MNVIKKMITALTLIAGVTLCSQPLFAEEQAAVQKEEPTSLWDSLRKKIETMTPKKKLVATTAVGGVRGALVESEDLYWKGEKTEILIDETELEDFNNALVLYEAGNTEGAQNAFGKFISDYPESKLLADANQALELITQAQ